MSESYTVSDLERETRGMKLIDKPFSQELVRVLGEEKAIRWFYHTRIPAFDNQTPHKYIEKRSDVSKSVVAGEFYAFLTGQPD